MRPSSGGGQTGFSPPREVDPRDVAVPAGYRVEAVATELTYPTGVAFDEAGQAYVTEAGYSYGEDWTTPRLLRIEANGEVTIIYEGENGGPWTGVDFHEGSFYIADSDVLQGGRVLRVYSDGEASVLIDNLPSVGDHHANGPVIGPDGYLYFGIGTATNSGVVGPDNAEYGWLPRHPGFHDRPGGEVVLAGANFTSADPLGGGEAKTGAFLPFGIASEAGQRIEGVELASGSIIRIDPGGGEGKQFAWGFRNPFGLAFSPDGELYVTENAYDDRGSRPVWGAPDLFRRVYPGLWHGWPDYSGQKPLTDPAFAPPGGKSPEFLMAEHPNEPPPVAAELSVHSSANGFDFSRSDTFGYRGQAFIALFGDLAPDVGKVMAPVGFKVVRVDPQTGEIVDFAMNRGPKNGPASLIGDAGLERPVAARFSPDGLSLYVVDFGVMTVGPDGQNPQPATGVLWRITREE